MSSASVFKKQRNKRRSLMPVTTNTFEGARSQRSVESKSPFVKKKKGFDLSISRNDGNYTTMNSKMTNYDSLNPGEAANKFYDKHII
jgi:hypothetical protein